MFTDGTLSLTQCLYVLLVQSFYLLWIFKQGTGKYILDFCLSRIRKLISFRKHKITCIFESWQDGLLPFTVDRDLRPVSTSANSAARPFDGSIRACAAWNPSWKRAFTGERAVSSGSWSKFNFFATRMSESQSDFFFSMLEHAIVPVRATEFDEVETGLQRWRLKRLLFINKYFVGCCVLEQSRSVGLFYSITVAVNMYLNRIFLNG